MNEVIDQSRRRLLTTATIGAGAIGVAFSSLPFLASWNPSSRAKAQGAPVEVDAAKLEPGQMLKVIWRGQPVFVLRRTQASIEAIGGHDALLVDPESLNSQQPDYIEKAGPTRARNPEYWIGLAVCTHASCLPLGAFEPNNRGQVAGVDLGHGWPGGFYCPCHGARGSKYDLSGRVFKNVPAPKNLPIPPYAISADAQVTIGVDALAKSG